MKQLRRKTPNDTTGSIARQRKGQRGGLCAGWCTQGQWRRPGWAVLVAGWVLVWAVVWGAGLGFGLGFSLSAGEDGGGGADGAGASVVPPAAIDPAMAGFLNAISVQDFDRVKLILAANPGLLEKPIESGKSTTPVWLAIDCNAVDVMEYFLTQGVRVQDFDPPGSSILVACLDRRQSDMARLLIEHGADVNNTVVGGGTPLNSAVTNHLDEIVDLLLVHGANLPPDVPNTEPILLLALAGNSPDQVRKLQAMGADIQLKAPDGRTAWHFAAHSLCADEMFPLVEAAKIDINAPDAKGETALMYFLGSDYFLVGPSIYQGLEPKQREQGLQFLVDHGADFKCITNKAETVLHFAARCGDAAEIRRCLAAGLDVNANTIEGNLPLDEALDWHNYVAAAELVAQGGSVTKIYPDGSTPLHRLFVFGTRGFGRYSDSTIYTTAMMERDIIKGLIRLGCDPNFRDKEDFTPLGLACHWHGKEEAIRVLLEVGADPNVHSDGEAPLWSAVKVKNWENVEILLAYGANPHTLEPNSGVTLLKYHLNSYRGDLLQEILGKWGSSNRNSSGSVLLCLYSAQQRPVNVGLIAAFLLVVLTMGVWIRRWVAVHGAQLTGAGAEATLDEISARADWKELLAKFEKAQAFQRRVFLHRPWILIGAFGWVFGVGFMLYDPILNLLVQPKAWWYVGIFSLAFLVSCGLQFARGSGWRIFGSALGIVVLMVGGFFAGLADYVLLVHSRLYFPGGLMALVILAKLTAAWRFHRTLKAEMALRKIKLPEGFSFQRGVVVDGAEIEPPPGWDEGKGTGE